MFPAKEKKNSLVQKNFRYNARGLRLQTRLGEFFNVISLKALIKIKAEFITYLQMF